MNAKELLQLHDDTCKACRVIMQKKNSDYTGGKGATDPFANFNASKILDIHPVQGLLLRVIDKIQRIRSFTNDKELSVPNETVEDACDDIVNYAILAKAMLRQERSQIEQDSPNKEPYPYDIGCDWIRVRSPTGRDNGLKIRPVRVRIPPRLPRNNETRME